jgi:hypothetical protein
LRKTYPNKSVETVLVALPTRKWGSMQAKASELCLHRPDPTPLGATLKREGDVGFCAGMIIADGSILEACIISGAKRARHEGGMSRPISCYSMPQVKISMEDKESLDRVATLWGRKTTFCQESSVGNDVWRVQIGRKKAQALLRLILPYLGGIKRKKALYLLAKYDQRAALPVKDRESFKPFGGMT